MPCVYLHFWILCRYFRASTITWDIIIWCFLCYPKKIELDAKHEEIQGMRCIRSSQPLQLHGQKSMTLLLLLLFDVKVHSTSSDICSLSSSCSRAHDVRRSMTHSASEVGSFFKRLMHSSDWKQKTLLKCVNDIYTWIDFGFFFNGFLSHTLPCLEL